MTIKKFAKINNVFSYSFFDWDTINSITFTDKNGNQQTRDGYLVKNNVIFKTEFINEKERIKHYAAADCVVLPSIYEPFGIVCTESMSMAKPTVVGASGTNGMREQIIPSGEKQCGIHINPYDPNDIAWGIKQVLQLEDKGKFMGENARKRVIENFSWDIVTKKLIDIYKEFI